MEVPQTVIDLINELDPPMRKRKLANEEALAAISFMLRSGVSWRDLRSVIRGCSASAVYKRFCSWVASGIFERVWQVLLTRYSDRRLATDARWFHDLFIDTTMIKNVGGVDGLGRNPTDRGRLATKMGAIVDAAGIPVAVQFFTANRNDVTTAMDTVAAIQCPIQPTGLLGPDRRYKHTIVGDKGYVSKHLQWALSQSGTRMLTPRKKNNRSKRTMHYDDRQRLRKRHKVENFFCRLDKFKRLHCRHDKTLASF